MYIVRVYQQYFFKLLQPLVLLQKFQQRCLNREEKWWKRIQRLGKREDYGCQGGHAKGVGVGQDDIRLLGTIFGS